MSKIKIINADAETISSKADLIFTDPPYDLPAKKLAAVFDKIDSNHLVLITTMKQLVNLLAISEWVLSFDFVIDAVVPKKSMSVHQPNYTHQTGVYLTRNGAKSLFNRKLRQRSDTFDGNGYWPTVIRAPRDRMLEHGMAKNQVAVTDILGSFDVKSVVDPFCGSGTTPFAAFELDISCIAIDIDAGQCEKLAKRFRFLGLNLSTTMD